MRWRHLGAEKTFQRESETKILLLDGLISTSFYSYNQQTYDFIG